MTPATVSAGYDPRSVTVCGMAPVTAVPKYAYVANATDPSGSYAYVANAGSDNISQYTIGADGALTAITLSVGAGEDPTSIVTTGHFEQTFFLPAPGSALEGESK